MKRILSFLMALLFVSSFALSLLPALPAKADATYEQSLRNAGFPESYVTKLSLLHDIHPNWQFKPVLITGMKSAYTWDYVINQEMSPQRNLIYHTYPWQDYATSADLLESGLWRQAKESTVEFFMDPRNFLDERNIFMFETLRSAGAVYTLSDIESALTGTFMANKTLENGKTYAQNFYDIGAATGVSALHLATRVKQEQGTAGTSPLISGTCGDTLWSYYSNKTNGAPASGYTEAGLKAYNGFYNYFNIGASGTGYFNIYLSGMQEAQQGGWRTRHAAIQAGAQKIHDKYISDYQHTLYFQKFNVHPSSSRNFWGQYMQNVSAAYSEGRSIQKTYADNGLLNSAFTFEIPVYSGMPDACPDPGSSFEASTFLGTVKNASKIDDFSYDAGVVNKLTSNISGNVTLHGETCIIDLAGHTWTNSTNAIVLATGSIYVYDSVGGGAIITSNEDAVSMGNGSAKFENITIKGGGDGMDAIYCDGGNLTVINCTLSGPKAGINVSNGSEASDFSARSVVTVNGGKFANYSGTKDSQGRNCAIEIRNNADEITLTGNITFENNKIISKKANTKSIKDSITTNGTFTLGADVADYVTATISFGGSSSGDSGNTDSDVIPGDMNGDTIVNAKDVTAHRRYLSEGWELTINMDLIDVNNDGNVNAKDVTELRRFISEGWEIELVIPGNGGNTENPGDNENPGDSGISAVVGSEIDISKLPTNGSFTGAGFDASQKFLNFQSGGNNSSTSHSIGIVDLSKYKEIIVSFGNDGGFLGKELATVVLKTASKDLISAVFTGSSGWKNFTTATFDVSSFNNNEELFMALASANGGFVVSKIELVPINGNTGDSGNTNPDSGNTGDDDNTGTGDSAVVGSIIDISKLSTSGSFTAAGFDASQKLLNFQSGGDNSATSHSIGKVDLSKYKEIIVTFSNDGTLSGKEVATVVLKTGSTDLTSAIFTGSNGWKSSSTATFDVSSLNNNEELFMALASANGGFVVSKIELVPINGNTGDSGNTNPDSGNTGTVTNGEINISSLSNAGTFTAAGYGSDVKVLNMATGGSNDSLKHSIGTHDLSKYNMLKVTYGTASGISSVGTLNLKDSSGNVIASVTLKPAGGWKATTTAELDVSKSSYNGALTLELTNQSNGAVITKLVFSAEKADAIVNISSLATSGAFTAAGYSNKILNFFTGGTNDAGSHSIGSHNLAGYNVLKVTYGTDPSVSTAGTLKLKDASGNVIASVSAPGSTGWNATRTIELDISKSTYNGALKLELADAKGGMAVTGVTLSADKADLDLTIKNLSTSGTFTQSGMSADKYVLNFCTGGQNDSGSHSIGTQSLEGYNNIFITYSTGAVSTIGTLQLTDAAGNVISSVTLSPSGGWLLNSRAKIDISGSTYSGELYLRASGLANGFAVSAIKFSANDNIQINVVENILNSAKKVADYVRVNGWTYGDAKVNPFFDKSEKLVSCDRYVGWVLGEAGFTEGQPTKKGLNLYGHNLDLGEGSLENFLKQHGFTKITDKTQVKAGDIIFVGDSNMFPVTAIPSATTRAYAYHTFIAASDYNAADGCTKRFDAGSNERLQSVQPSYEVLDKGEQKNYFRFAYRAPGA